MLKSHSLTFTLFHSHTLALSHSHTLSFSHSLSLDMLNNFCFHVYAQKSVFIGENGNEVFSWEPALETPNSRAADEVKKKPLQFSVINSDF